ncbi:uncharacterized protein N7479_004383 [Penicillium vulpinum]|uniref:Uncharacterized protein n=1 Tax=Penicillium vulpinum TaxID=29845 RepID=A0A1V6SC89_9EURO|nr:uncharacterized protein N7479_004383 [Penicillium vulpinum]KAJ5964507.1 hypothetical protein N7479_004383 [Penicillium vulpinum]OQE11556.1 hypothetical protein PENVUL_c002G02841 [Penicillium vulpinum]
MDSPAKKRKISETTGISVAPELSKNDPHQSRPPSFQSPTRASLARSHPDILERAISRSPARRPADKDSGQQDPRKFGLRDRKALRPSLTASASPLTRPRGPEAPQSSPNRRPSGVQAFAKPPRRISRRILPGDLVFGSPMPQPKNPDSNTPEHQLALELGSATREADMNIGPDPNFMDEDMLEPDLPPTPTQLGLEKAPDRPRGMVSSSPSRRQEKRAKRRTANALYESPLKAVNFQSPPLEDLETASDLGAGSAAVREKRSSREKSAADLRRLRNEVEELESWAKQIESNPDLKDEDGGLDRFLSLLTSEEANRTSLPVVQTTPKSISSILATLLPFATNIPRPKRELSPLPTNPFALQEASQSLPYLTAFAPLTLKTRTTRSSRREELSEIHTLSFSPPSPFPASLYNVTVIYETNPETQSLTSLSVPTGSDSKKRKVPEALRRWIDTRLENPLLKLDVATLCWGINRYWESAITRARLWAHIDQKYGPRASRDRKDAASESKNGVITLSELRRLVPHLDRSAMIIKPKSSDSSPRVLLSNTLLLDDWTGESQLRPEISVSMPGVDKKIDQETKKLFHALLREDGALGTRGVEGGIHVDAVVRATEGALGALFGGL